MKNIFKIFAVVSILTTGCGSQQQSQLPTNTTSNSTPVVQSSQTENTSYSPQNQTNVASQTNIPMPSNQWVPVGKTPDNSIVSVDIGSLTRSGDIVGFWSQANYAVLRNPAIAVSRSYATASCSNRNFQILWIATADPQGRILQNGKTEIKLDATPESIADMTLQYACQNQADLALQFQANQAKITKAQLDALARDRETNARAISDAFNTAFSGVQK